jgi:hypothetical protein
MADRPGRVRNHGFVLSTYSTDVGVKLYSTCNRDLKKVLVLVRHTYIYICTVLAACIHTVTRDSGIPYPFAGVCSVDLAPLRLAQVVRSRHGNGL